MFTVAICSRLVMEIELELGPGAGGYIAAAQAPVEEATVGALLEEPQFAQCPRSGSTSEHGGSEDREPALAGLFGSDDSEPETDFDEALSALAISTVSASPSSRTPSV